MTAGDPADKDPAAADRRLARLNAQADKVRAELDRLRRDLAQVQREFSSSRAAQLLEANEQLVLAAVQADAIAETAMSNLDQLTRSAQRDTLTDTPNRVLMQDRMEHAIALARRRGMRMAIVFVDLDGFKQINDTLGHEQGDEALRQFAHCLTQTFRVSDVVARVGGDEFVALLSAAGLGDIPPALARLQRHVDIVNRRKGATWQLRYSAGSSVVVSPGAAGLREALQHADQQMYARKREHAGHGMAFAAEPSAAF
jgi:diguanylate cyclase (GGDEF)-like protein